MVSIGMVEKPDSGFGGQNDSMSMLERRKLLKALLASAGASSFGAGAAGASSDGEFLDILGIDPSEYPLVKVSVVAETDAGSSGELTEADFEIIEDGVSKEITGFQFTDTRADIAFVFDDSGSMWGEIAGMKEEVKNLTDTIEGQGIDTRYALVSFKDVVEVDLPFTDDATELKSTVDDLWASGGGDFPEANFDAIEQAIDLDFRSDAQKVIVDITDALSHYRGDGSGISDYTLDEVATDLKEHGIAYFAVAPNYDDPQASKKNLATEVDGRWMDIYDAEFTLLLEDFLELVITSYILGYETSLDAGDVADVEIIAEDPVEGTDSSGSSIMIPEDVDDDDFDDAFDDLRGTKLALADRLESITNEDIEEAATVETLLGNIKAAADDGDIDDADALERVERMLLAEGLTNEALTLAGPATFADGTKYDYDIGTETVRTAFDTVFTPFFLAKKVFKWVKKVPGLKGVVRKAEKLLEDAMGKFLNYLLNDTPLSEFVKRQVGDVADDLASKIQNDVIGSGEAFATEYATETTGLFDIAGQTLVDKMAYPRFEVGHDIIHSAADPDDETTSFSGDFADAETAAAGQRSYMQDITQEMEGTFDTFDEVIDIAELGDIALAFTGIAGIFTGGIATAIASAGALINMLFKLVVNITKTYAGWHGLSLIRDGHRTGILGVRGY